MEVINLCSSPSSSSVLVKVGDDVHLMFDVPFDAYTSLMHFMPCTTTQSTLATSTWTDGGATIDESVRVCGPNVFVDARPEVGDVQMGDLDIGTIDAIFISSSQHMTCLPYLCAMPSFRATIYATDPTARLGRLLMEELALNVDHVNKDDSDATSTWRGKEVHGTWANAPTTDPRNWRRVYGLEEVRDCMRHVRLIAYNEQVSVANRVTVVAVSAGYAIGSCNWRVSTLDEAVTMSIMCDSSSLSAHPRPLEMSALLSGTDVLCVNSVASPSHHARRSPADAVKHMCDVIVKTLREHKGNVLIPCNANGVLYDVFEFVVEQINNQLSSDIGIYYISPRAQHLCALADVYGEWLNVEKQSRLFQADMPFQITSLIKHERLRTFSSVMGEFSGVFRQPCVVFASDSTMRLGASAHFMAMWRGEGSHAVVHIDPLVDMAHAIAPYQPLVMRAFNCSIDTRLTHGELAATKQKPRLATLMPKVLVDVQQIPGVTTWPYLSTYTLPPSPLAALRHLVDVHPDLLAGVQLSTKHSSVPLVGQMTMQDNMMTVASTSAVPNDVHDVLASGQRLAGRLRCEHLMQILKATDMDTVLKKTSDTDFSISIAQMNTTLWVREGRTTEVEVHKEDEDHRLLARNILAQCLQRMGGQSS